MANPEIKKMVKVVKKRAGGGVFSSRVAWGF